METFNCPTHGEYQADPVTLVKKDLSNNSKSKYLTPPCPKCCEEADEKEKLKQEKKGWEANFKRIQAANFPVEFRGLKLSSFKPKKTSDPVNSQKILSKIQNYTDNFKFGTTEKNSDKWFRTIKFPKSLLFLGNNGTGKTHLSCALAQDLLFKNKINSALFTTTYDLILMIKNTWGSSEKTEEQIVNNLCDIDFMIIDEVGVQFGTDTETLLFFNVFNKRLNNGKPTVIISNNNTKEFKSLMGPRIYDRIRNTDLSVFDWKSLRGRK